MPCNFRWGTSFIVLEAEFWPWQVAEILDHANSLFDRRPQSDGLKKQRIRVSIIPFEKFGYGFCLVLRVDEWTLEVVDFPPHAKPGERVRSARRKREREERKSGITRRCMIMIKRWKARAHRFLSKSYKKINQLCRTVGALFRQASSAVALPPRTVREELMRWVNPSLELCQSASIGAWFEDKQTSFRGLRLEQRLFLADIGLPMWLWTLPPIETVFVLGGVSIFGERTLESELVS